MSTAAGASDPGRGAQPAAARWRVEGIPEGMKIDGAWRPATSWATRPRWAWSPAWARSTSSWSPGGSRPAIPRSSRRRRGCAEATSRSGWGRSQTWFDRKSCYVAPRTSSTWPCYTTGSLSSPGAPSTGLPIRRSRLSRSGSCMDPRPGHMGQRQTGRAFRGGGNSGGRAGGSGQPGQRAGTGIGGRRRRVLRRGRARGAPSPPARAEGGQAGVCRRHRRRRHRCFRGCGAGARPARCYPGDVAPPAQPGSDDGGGARAAGSFDVARAAVVAGVVGLATASGRLAFDGTPADRSGDHGRARSGGLRPQLAWAADFSS